jgi:hypothetical protein
MFAFILAAAVAAAPPTNPCAYDRGRLLALDQNAFDQDLKGGWRVLAENPRCYVAAADLIRDYREAHHSMDSILFWHEGQMRAEAGQSEAAIALFERSRAKNPDWFGWNFYVDGTVSFLRHDRAQLQAARDKLAALPRPADFHPIGPDGKPFQIKWPPNLNVLDGFLACFNSSYEKAYGSATCTQPVAKVQVPDR